MKRFIILLGIASLTVAITTFCLSSLFAGDVTALYPNSEPSPIGPLAGDIKLNGHKFILDADEDSYIYSSADDTIRVVTNAVDPRFMVTNAGVTVNGKLIFHNKGIFYSDTDEYFIFSDSAQTKNVCADVTTDAHLKLYDGDCAAAADLTVSGALSVLDTGYQSFSGSVKVNNNKNLVMGSANESFLRWNSSQTNNMATYGLGASRTLVIMDAADLAVDLGYANATTTTLTIQSGDHAQLTEWISFTHDATNGVIDVGEGKIEFKDDLILKGYTRHHDFPIGAAALGPTAPTFATLGSFRCAVMDANADELYFISEIPSEWNGSSNMSFNLNIFTEAGDALGNGEIIEFDIIYRSIDMAGNEAYDNGTAVTVYATKTGGASETDKGGYTLATTIAYTGGNQPLAVGDRIGLFVIRDVTTTDTYSGDVHVCKAELEYTADKPGSH